MTEENRKESDLEKERLELERQRLALEKERLALEAERKRLADGNPKKKIAAMLHKRMVILALSIAAISATSVAIWWILFAAPSGVSGSPIYIPLSSVHLNGSQPLPSYNNETINTSGLYQINEPLNATQLSLFNNPNQGLFDTAAKMILNGTVPFCSQQGQDHCISQVLPENEAFYVNGKPSVIYWGGTTCVFCGENRWAMALALSEFGKFSHLFMGYSSVQDGDVPTLYWTQDELYGAKLDMGNYYSSSYINFVSLEDTGQIQGGFTLESIPSMETEAAVNPVTSAAVGFMLNVVANFTVGTYAPKGILQTQSGSVNLHGLSVPEIAQYGFGTPQTYWGSLYFPGVSSVDFYVGSTIIKGTSFSHQQIISLLSKPNTTFAWTEYAGAVSYVTGVCKSINNTAPACDSTIKQLESRI